MANYKTLDLGSLESIINRENGKAFLHDELGLTSCEISVSVMPKSKLPLNHKHKQNEKVYIFLKGKGIFTVDGNAINVKEGTVIKVAPTAVRTLENSSDELMQYICVQAKDGSLSQFGMGDGEFC